MAVDVAFLKSIPYFSRLSRDELDLVQKLIFEKKVERGDIIVLEGESAEAIYFVGSGAVKTFRTSVDGKEQVLKIVRPGESFNDVAIFDSGPNLASARAMGPAIVYGILQRDLHAFLQEHPQIALNVANVLAAQLRHLASLVDDLSFRPVVSRVAKILLEYAGNGAGPSQRLTQQDMAAIVGIYFANNGSYACIAGYSKSGNMLILADRWLVERLRSKTTVYRLGGKKYT